ncbi:MAG: DUF4352 domain-containing protein [Cellulomonadaceae bacterium]
MNAANGPLPDPSHPTQPPLPPAPEKRRSWFARHKILTGLGGLILVGMIGSAMSGGGEDPVASPGPDARASTAAAQDVAAGQEETPSADQDEAGAGDAQEVATEAEPEPAAAAGVGSAVRDGKFEFTVTAVETGLESVGESFMLEEAQGQFVLVRVTVHNVGDEAQYFSGSDQELIDEAGRTHSADTMAAIALGDADSFLNQINPGITVEGVVVFDIPVDAVPTSIVLHDSMFSGGVEVALG